jgi:carbon monoxide dehydrogenase subunit G
MDFTGEERIAASRAAVWAALNDPDILRRCIPGCEAMERMSANEFAATIKVKFSLFSATFHGVLLISNVDAPKSYTLSAEGKGGIAGFARGSADVVMEEDGGETVLHYRGGAELGGKIAQFGARLLESSARRLADRFFSKFAAAVVEKAGAPGGDRGLG